MVWTAKVISKNLSKGQLTIEIEYTDGSEIITETLKHGGVPKPNWVANAVFQKIKFLKALESYIAGVVIGKIIPIDSNPPDTIEAKAFQENMNRLRDLDLLLRRGVIVEPNSDVEALKASLADWKSYI